ncbi:unnamed protein product [Lathyrus sativus]|nr:unnamed protein product [Lathyrus sativus]
MDEAKTTPLLKRKQPQQTLTSPVTLKKQVQQTLTSLHLPFDLVAEILCRLPVKHLIQFCCVCKSWGSLISGDSKFAKKHLRLSNSRDDRHHLIMRMVQDSPEFFLCHSPISSILSSASTTQYKSPLEVILNKRYHGIEISACDGILCISIEWVNDSFVLLYNPSIRKLKILPPLKFTHQRYVVISYTLVYDRFTNNYKVIAIAASSSKKEVNIHTLGTDCWRRINQDFPGPHLILIPRSGIFVNDSVNWLVYEVAGGSGFIVSLDFVKESYQKLSLPVFDMLFTISFMTLGTLRGCLSLLTPLFQSRDKFSDIWIMKEYDNEKSWIKLLSVPHMKEYGFYGYTKALYVSKDDQVLMEFLKNGKYNLVVYDSINNIFKIPKFQNKTVARAVYVESLISSF